ncbi:MAG: hypothetical protein NTX59_11690 [Elusimicrobia bacterium]|nr:hypothetical protein [Elusimicrobiota bacterium]
MSRLIYRKGMILLQVLVMSVILSMIAVMVMQWVLGRYIVAARTYKSSTTKVRAQGYSANLFCTPAAFTGAPVGSGSVTDSEGKTVSHGSAGTKFTITSDEDQ